MNRNILVTGAAGFIGASVIKKLILNGDNVLGIDNLNSYYQVSLKKYRLKEINELSKNKNCWHFYKASLENYEVLEELFNKHKPKVVINLAAQAGVRYSLIDPKSYIQSNLVGFGNIIELSKKFCIENFIYASSSSVYGGNAKLPFEENDPVNHPVSLYAATKKSNELIAHSYSHIYRLPSTCLRFFTVYGPLGRPDMAPMIFAKSILNSEPIQIYNFGKMSRDFTYIEDISEGIFRCSLKPAIENPIFNREKPEPSTSNAPHMVFNIGNNKPVELLYFIELLENCLEKKAIKIFKPMQPGDVEKTFADTKRLEKWINFSPSTTIEEGVETFSKWYKKFYNY